MAFSLQRQRTRNSGFLDVLEQHAEDGVALLAAQADDAVGEGVVDEQAVLARLRMGPHHRMRHRRVGGHGPGVRLGALRCLADSA